MKAGIFRKQNIKKGEAGRQSKCQTASYPLHSAPPSKRVVPTTFGGA